MRYVSRFFSLCIMLTFCVSVSACSNGSLDEDQSLSTSHLALGNQLCFSDSMGGPTSCKPEATWLSYASDVCADSGMIVSQHSVAIDCDGGFRAIKFECCPGDTIEQVCCKTSDGPQLTSAEKCKKAGYSTLPDEACTETDELICCKTPYGPQWAPQQKCEQSGLSVIANKYCEQEPEEVCCKTKQGTVWTTAQKCKHNG